MNGKRGEDILMKNVLSVILFIVSFALIAYGVYKVYGVFLNQELKNAQNTLDKISAKIGAIEDGKNTTLTMQGFSNSRSWRIVAWSKSDSVDMKPEPCYYKSCICICKASSYTQEGDLEDCKKNNLCKTFDYDEIIINRAAGTPSQFAYSGSYLCLPKNIAELFISRSSNKLVMEYTKESGSIQCYQ